eukprot:Tbor_TRINITY_DN5839_c0_g1::TRINITY_DN5839_c0_g1_i5::g.6258::m.6258
MSLMPESIAEKLQVQYRNAFHRDDLLKFYNFFKFANVTCTLKYREDLVSHWGKKWNVAIKKPKKAVEANDFLMYNSLQVLAMITASFSGNINYKFHWNVGDSASGASGKKSLVHDSSLPFVSINRCVGVASNEETPSENVPVV